MLDDDDDDASKDIAKRTTSLGDAVFFVKKITQDEGGGEGEDLVNLTLNSICFA